MCTINIFVCVIANTGKSVNSPKNHEAIRCSAPTVKTTCGQRLFSPDVTTDMQNSRDLLCQWWYSSFLKWLHDCIFNTVFPTFTQNSLSMFMLLIRACYIITWGIGQNALSCFCISLHYPGEINLKNVRHWSLIKLVWT